MSEFSREEVKAHFDVWRSLVDHHDLAGMARLLTDDVKGGNAVFGISEGRDAVLGFMDRWPESIPNESLWVAIDGARVVNKWRETLPGDSPTGASYHYDGITELHYAGSQRWSFMYGLPDLFALKTAYSRWKSDSHEEKYGALYPGL